jgi:hypothetical protein
MLSEKNDKARKGFLGHLARNSFDFLRRYYPCQVQRVCLGRHLSRAAPLSFYSVVFDLEGVIGFYFFNAVLGNENVIRFYVR